MCPPSTSCSQDGDNWLRVNLTVPVVERAGVVQVRATVWADNDIGKRGTAPLTLTVDPAVPRVFSLVLLPPGRRQDPCVTGSTLNTTNGTVSTTVPTAFHRASSPPRLSWTSESLNLDYHVVCVAAEPPAAEECWEEIGPFADLGLRAAGQYNVSVVGVAIAGVRAAPLRMRIIVDGTPPVASAVRVGGVGEDAAYWGDGDRVVFTFESSADVESNVASYAATLVREIGGSQCGDTTETAVHGAEVSTTDPLLACNATSGTLVANLVHGGRCVLLHVPAAAPIAARFPTPAASCTADHTAVHG